eukprot:4239474-Prymnesium_polylepis.1
MKTVSLGGSWGWELHGSMPPGLLWAPEPVQHFRQPSELVGKLRPPRPGVGGSRCSACNRSS